MKGLGLGQFCLLASLLTLGFAENSVSPHDLTADHLSDSQENGINETKDSHAKSEIKDQLLPFDVKEVEAEGDLLQRSDTQEFSNENLKESDILLKDSRQGYHAPQVKHMKEPAVVHLGTAPSNGHFLANSENIFLNQNQKPLVPGILKNNDDISGYAQSPNGNMRNFNLIKPNTNSNVQNVNQVLANSGEPDSAMTANQMVVGGSNYNSLVRSGRPDDQDDEREDSEAKKSFSRRIPNNERILLNQIPGTKNLVTCSREGELHNFWSSRYQCLVCACIREYGDLRPVCATCAGCMASVPAIVDVPKYVIPAHPTNNVVYDVSTSPSPPFEEEVTCSPLPSGKPFENPLHPCQVCICIESIDAHGKPDVHIQCQENPQCVLPTDKTVLPSIPDVPVSSPYCDKFPLNVLFPHPSDSCKTCRCSVQLSPRGVPEKQITCLPNPDCSPSMVTPEYKETPNRYPISIDSQIAPTQDDRENELFFEIIAPEPSPSVWTPEAPVGPPRPPGPLPGPSPHDSCRPYLPNRPFQHPWDECQMCVCAEAIAKGHVTIEVNCYTKSSCCIELPFDMISQAETPPSVQQRQDISVYQGQLGSSSSINSNKVASQFQNKAISSGLTHSNNYPYGGSYGGSSIGHGQSSDDQPSVYPLNQNYQRPDNLPLSVLSLRPGNFQNLQRPDPTFAYGPQNKGFPGYNTGYPIRNAFQMPSYQANLGLNTRNYPGQYNQPAPGFGGQSVLAAKAQASASASASAGVQSGSYAAGYQRPVSENQGYPGLRNIGPKLQQYANNIASAASLSQSTSISGTRIRGKSGKPDDNESLENEN